MVEETAFVEQLLVAALFNDLAMVDNNHIVGVTNRAETVGDDETGSTLHQAQQRFLNASLGAGIDAARRLIQDQDIGVSQDGACNGKQLALALAQVAGPLRSWVW